MTAILSASAPLTDDMLTAATPIAPGHRTTEFYLVLALGLLGAAVSSGLVPQTGELARVVAFVSTSITTTIYVLARTGLKKAAAASAPMLSLFVLGAALLASGCSGARGAAVALGKDVIDCTAPRVAGLVTEFAPALEQVLTRATDGAGHIDGASVAAAAKNFGVGAGGCVLASVVARALKPPAADPSTPKASPLLASPADLRAMFNDVRATKLGGATFKTDAGTL